MRQLPVYFTIPADDCEIAIELLEKAFLLQE